MEQNEKEQLEKLFNEDNQLNAKTLLIIKSRPKLTVSEDDSGMELNDGYEFEVNGAIPEIADGIAKFAVVLEQNDFGENSSTYFIKLINEYFNKLTTK